MRSFGRAINFAAATSILTSLVGCGVQDFYENKGGVGALTPAAVTTYFNATGAISDAKGRRLTAREYLIASIAHTNERCINFFNVLEHYKQDASLIDSVISAAVLAGAPLLAPVITAKNVAGFTSALTFANTYNKSAAQIFAFSDYKEQLMAHVFGAMQSYVENLHYPNIKITAFNDSTISETERLMVARSMASDYASLCSLAQMRQIVSGALNKSETKIRKDTSPNFLAPSYPTTTAKTAGG
jgi:hypothetical protein